MERGRQEGIKQRREIKVSTCWYTRAPAGGSFSLVICRLDTVSCCVVGPHTIGHSCGIVALYAIARVLLYLLPGKHLYLQTRPNLQDQTVKMPGQHQDGDDDKRCRDTSTGHYLSLFGDLLRSSARNERPPPHVMEHREVMRNMWMAFGAAKSGACVALIVAAPWATGRVARRVGICGWRSTALKGTVGVASLLYWGPFPAHYVYGMATNFC